MGQSLQSAEEEPSPGPVALTLLALGDESVPTGIDDALEREVIEVTALPGGAVAGEPPDSDVVVVWLPAGAGEDQLTRLVRWIGGSPGQTGLIGCSPAGERTDAENALAAGFDDFVVGDISVRELAARVRALYRRLQLSAAQVSEGPRFGSITLDPARHQMWIGGRRIILTRTELAVMTALVGAQGRAISRAEILDSAWGDQNFDVGERAVDNVIMRLRRKLGDKDAIITVRGVGFRLRED
jgi:DNA-binding response OmpR family regulator